jgi:hypothetical protein
MLVQDEKNRMDFISLKSFCEAQKQKWLNRPSSPVQSQVQPNYQIAPNFENGWNGFNRNEPSHQNEISPENLHSKGPLNYEVPHFSQEPAKEPNYRFDYMDPVPLKPNVPQNQAPVYQYPEPYSTFQPKNGKYFFSVSTIFFENAY